MRPMLFLNQGMLMMKKTKISPHIIASYSHTL